MVKEAGGHISFVTRVTIAQLTTLTTAQPLPGYDTRKIDLFTIFFHCFKEEFSLFFHSFTFAFTIYHQFFTPYISCVLIHMLYSACCFFLSWSVPCCVSFIFICRVSSSFRLTCLSTHLFKAHFVFEIPTSPWYIDQCQDIRYTMIDYITCICLCLGHYIISRDHGGKSYWGIPACPWGATVLNGSFLPLVAMYSFANISLGCIRIV